MVKCDQDGPGTSWKTGDEGIELDATVLPYPTKVPTDT